MFTDLFVEESAELSLKDMDLDIDDIEINEKDFNKNLKKLDALKLEEEFDITISSDVKDFTSNSLFEELLDPESKDITNNILEMRLNKNCTTADMYGMLESILNADLTDYTKSSLITRLNEAYAETIMLEYSGNDAKNKEFIKAVQGAKEYVVNVNAHIIMLDKLGTKVLKEMEKYSAKKNNSRDIYIACMDYVQDYFKESRPLMDKLRSNWKDVLLFDKIKKTFNNKYATTLEDIKEDMDKQLSKLSDEIATGPACDWIVFYDGAQTKKWKDLVAAWDDIKRYDSQVAGNLAKNVINPFYETLFNNVKNGLNIIAFIRYWLNIEAKNTTKYKIVQKIFKDKKKTDANDKNPNASLDSYFDTKTFNVTI